MHRPHCFMALLACLLVAASGHVWGAEVTFREGTSQGYVGPPWDVVSIITTSEYAYPPDNDSDWFSEAIRVSGDPCPPTEDAEQYYVLLAIKDLLTARRARLGPWGQAPCRLRCLPSKRLSCVLACITLDHCDARV